MTEENTLNENEQQIPAVTGKTAELRKLCAAQLNLSSGLTYYMNAPPDAVHPYKVFTLSRVDLGDLSRNDYDLCVDILDHATDPKTVDMIGDAIEDQFNAANLPQASILPTFFRDSRYPIEEKDREIQRIQLHFTVQLYTIP